jgi:hypothetical protein
MTLRFIGGTQMVGGGTQVRKQYRLIKTKIRRFKSQQ